MNVHDLSPEQAERLVQGNKKYLESIIALSINKDFKIKEIARISNRAEIKNIYSITLTDNTMLIIKLARQRSVASEIKGMQYAEKNNIPAPKLHYSAPTEKNTLGTPFLIMDYVLHRPIGDELAGDDPVIKYGAEYKINPKAVEKHVTDSIAILQKLHQPRQIFNPAYSRFYDFLDNKNEQIMQRIEIKTREASLKPEEAKRLKAFAAETLDYFMLHKGAFMASKLFYLHGDPDPVNLWHSPEGIILGDWECFHEHDCAREIAYFMERNICLPDNMREECEGRIIDSYSKNDPSFSTRLIAYKPLTALMDFLYHPQVPKDLFFERMAKEFKA